VPHSGAAAADKPIALFIPGLLASLPLAAVRALAFVDLFDVVLCELPGHGASGHVADVSVAAFAAEYAALIDAALQRATGLFVIGESLGGLVALALAHLRPGQIRNVVLIDTPFVLTRPELADWIGQAWRDAGRRPYVRRICHEIMGFDPEDGRIERTVSLYDMVCNARFNCAHITGGGQQSSGIASVVTEADVAALRAANPAILAPPRIGGTGHAVLLDNAPGARAALGTVLVKRAS
jgi:pimeloyl-ACP methyl ester carboxylesterase